MRKEKIIVALDVETADEAAQIIENLKGEVGAFKIGLQLFTSAGSQFVREIVEAGVKVFLDLKFHDIPNTAAKASVEAARLGVWMFNIHALGGSEMMRRTVGEVSEACVKENLKQPKIIGVTVLTSSNEQTLIETGINQDSKRQVLNLAQLAYESGLDGVVASPLEVNLIKQNIPKKNFLVVTPGVRPKSMTSDIQDDDQKRVLSPAEAISAGADYLVIGRPILKSENPVRAVRGIIADMEKSDGNRSDIS
ncbi:MAG: orotidine-5'-phosphate decarboxylase [Pyrinomonadaceae bacterium]